MVTIVWPARGRLIPDACNSITIVMQRGSATAATQTVARPAAGGTSTVDFSSLPIGDLTAAASAYPTTNGTGVAQATGSVPLTIQAGQVAQFTVTMASTIDHIDLSPATPSVLVGGATTLTATAKDSAGSVVLTSAAKGQWSVDNSAIATVDSSGKVTGVAAGATAAHFTDTESGKAGAATVRVTAIPAISFAPAVSYTVPGAGDIVAAGDLDGDGKADVAIAGGGNVGALFGRGDGTLEPYVRLLSWKVGINVREVADLNGDGKPDIILTDASGSLVVLYNQGARHFALPYVLNLGTAASGLCVADLNHDGRPDIAVAEFGNGGSGAVQVLLNAGGGTFTKGASLSHIGIVEGVAAGDVDGDATPDLAVTYETSTVGQSGVSIYYGDGSGGFRSGPSYNIGTQNMNSPQLVDLNGDGKRDLAMCHYWGFAVAVFLNNGIGTFGPVKEYSSSNGYPIVIRVTDLDGDGRPDIVVADAGTSHIGFYRNKGAGVFADAVLVDSGGSNCRSVYVADVNNDGKPDLVTQNESTANVGVLLNTTGK